jgi:hypothetical protein
VLAFRVVRTLPDAHIRGWDSALDRGFELDAVLWHNVLWTMRLFPGKTLTVQAGAKMLSSLSIFENRSFDSLFISNELQTRHCKLRKSVALSLPRAPTFHRLSNVNLDDCGSRRWHVDNQAIRFELH